MYFFLQSISPPPIPLKLYLSLVFLQSMHFLCLLVFPFVAYFPVDCQLRSAVAIFWHNLSRVIKYFLLLHIFHYLVFLLPPSVSHYSLFCCEVFFSSDPYPSFLKILLTTVLPLEYFLLLIIFPSALDYLPIIYVLATYFTCKFSF